MNTVLQHVIDSNTPSFEFKRFRSMAEGRNCIEQTTEYTSNMRDSSKTYVGRGSKAGFICKDGIYNQFIDMSKTDGKWTNRFIDNRFIETWKNPSKREAIDEWMNAKKDMVIRLFVKQVDSKYYEGVGIYRYSGHSDTGVLWTKLD